MQSNFFLLERCWWREENKRIAQYVFVFVATNNKKTYRFIVSSKLLMTHRILLQQLRRLINLITLQRRPGLCCLKPDIRSFQSPFTCKHVRRKGQRYNVTTKTKVKFRFQMGFYEERCQKISQKNKKKV